MGGTESKTCQPGKDDYKLQLNKAFKHSYIMGEEVSLENALGRCTAEKEKCKGVATWDYGKDKEEKQTIYVVMGNIAKNPSNDVVSWKGACLYAKHFKVDESQDPRKPWYILGGFFGSLLLILFIIWLVKKSMS
jgi:hypothetical protein